MSYHHLTKEERGTLAFLNRNGHGIREIARRLGRSPSTISRELGRNGREEGYYRADPAQASYLTRRRNILPWKLEKNPALVEYIWEKLILCWSPEQIAGRLPIDYPNDIAMRISHSTLYRWLKLELLPQSVELRRNLRHYSRRHGEKRGYRVGARELKTRSREVLYRKRLGDWEVDTMVSGLAPHNVHLLNITERKSRYCCLAVLRSVKKEAMLKAFAFFFQDGGLPLKTMTSDRGVEFNCHREFEDKFQALFYFTRPRSPWQKPTVENQNGLIRQFFPKGYDFYSLTEKEVQKVMDLLNNRPRKCLAFRTPAEVLRFT